MLLVVECSVVISNNLLVVVICSVTAFVSCGKLLLKIDSVVNCSDSVFLAVLDSVVICSGTALVSCGNLLLKIDSVVNCSDSILLLLVVSAVTPLVVISGLLSLVVVSDTIFSLVSLGSGILGVLVESVVI